MSKKSNIPTDLRERPQWVLHRDKVPHAPGAYRASSTDSQTWSCFEEVLEMARTGQYDGIGFVLSSGDPFVGLDLDDCISGGDIEPWALEIVEALTSYTEVSPSGTGLHIFVKGKLPVGGCKTSMPGGGELEMYARERYLTVTGDLRDKKHSAVEDRSEEIKALYAKHFVGDPARGAPSVNGRAGNDVAGFALVEKAKKAKNGRAFAALWEGDTSAHEGDHSKADLALCSSLAFWTGGDAEQMDQLFRQSGLMRPKWDEQRGAQTYGERTIRKALEGQSEFYKPRAKRNGRAETKDGTDAGRSEKKDVPQSERLLRMVEDVELFHAPDGTAYATFEQIGATHTTDIGSSTFADLLRQRFFEAEGRPPASQALQDAKDVLRARARFDGPKREVHLRVAEHNGCIYIDLCNDAWEIIAITPSGWKIIDASEAPVRFRRTAGMKALPHPERGGSLDLLRRHVPVQDDEAFALLLGFLVQALREVGPYPLLCLIGEQGSGKTTVAKIIRALIDPSHVPVRTLPREERDLVVEAENNRMLVHDNLSGIQAWLSDAYCRLSTGGGFGTRRLYSNREEELFYALRPVILNGIDDLTTRGDLADRAITLRLRAIDRAERRTETDVWAAFRRDQPLILGALFGAVSTALGRVEGVTLDTLPRMADFAEWAVAAEPALPISEGAFMDAYTGNRASAREDAVANDTVASAIVDMLDDVGEWTGKTSTLLEDLKPYVPDPDRPPRDYPNTYQAMGHHLRRIMPALRGVGIDREDDPRERSRTFTLRKITCPKEADEAHGKGSRDAESGSDRTLHQSKSAQKRTRADASTPAERPEMGERPQRPLRPHHLPPQSTSPNGNETERSREVPGETDYKGKEADEAHEADEWHDSDAQLSSTHSDSTDAERPEVIWEANR